MMSTAIYAGIDLGGTKMAVVLASADGAMIAEKSIPTHSHEGPRKVVARMARLINDLAEQSGVRPHAAGIGVPGTVDIRQAIVKFLPNLATKWRDIPLRDWLSPAIGCAVYVLNDARLATLGELTYGAGRTANSMALITLGTGIGGGVVIDKKLRLGPLGSAGEIGHHTILPYGLPCSCGSRGCLETLASGPALSARGMWLA